MPIDIAGLIAFMLLGYGLLELKLNGLLFAEQTEDNEDDNNNF